MSVGTLWDPTNHYLISGQSVPQHILVEPLVTAGHQAHQIHFLPPPDGWPNRGRQPDDRAHPVHVQFQAPPHMG
jgi:hypothetical protein